MIKGIDVSRWQGIINWDAVKQSDAKFVIIKVAGSDAGYYTDGQFYRNKGEARRLGIPHMFYYFLGGFDPIVEANHFVQSVGDLQDGEGLCLDYEINTADDENYLAKVAKQVKELVGFPPLIYMSASRVHSKPWSAVRALGCGLWIASWGNNDPIPDNPPSPTPWPFFAIWQFSSTGQVPGISGRVDMDLFNSNDLAAFSKYGKKGAVSPPPTERTYTVVAGDTLWSISRKFYGDGKQWPRIWRANTDKIKDPNRIYVGQVFRIP